MRTFLVLCFVVFLAPVVAVGAEEITEFNVDITVHTDGSLLITESIVYDFEDNQRHGIFRTLPRRHPQSSGTWYTDRVIEVVIKEVRHGDSISPYTESRSAQTIKLQIGDPEETITGTQTYTIVYEVVGALTYYDDGEVDLYWNVTGNEWSVPISRAQAVVSGDVVQTQSVGSCYVGQLGSRAACAEAMATGTNVVYTSGSLDAGSGLTVAQALDASAVAVQVREEWNLWWLWLAVAVLWLVGLGIYGYRHYQRHNPKRAVVTQYEPYADFKPMFTGVLLDGTLHSRDITAGILYLAEQGFLKIRKTEHTVLWFFSGTDYELELLREPQETETTFQHELLRLLFSDSTTVGTTTALHELKRSTSKQKQNQKIIARLKKGIEGDLVTRGFYEKVYRPALYKAGKAVAVLVLVALLVVVLGLAGIELMLGVVGLTIVTFVLLAILSHRRTEKGYAARNHLQGFKHFLSMTGTKRFAFHDAPAKSPEQFTEYLPYAVAFGVEKEWAEVFADITIPPPSWYSDATGSNQFAVIALVNDLGNFSQNFSQSTGTSASSGGGSVGGGAGGGGGGSW